MIEDPTRRPGDPGLVMHERAMQMERLRAIAERLGTSFAGAFGKGAAEGERMDRVVSRLRRSLMEVGLRLARAPLQNLVQRGLGALLGGGGSGPRVTPFAKGGVVAAPTWFPMQGGLGLMGERGAEAILPLARGPDGRLGVAAASGGERPITVTVNIATPDPQSFRRSEAHVSATLARAVARGRRAM